MLSADDYFYVSLIFSPSGHPQNLIIDDPYSRKLTTVMTDFSEVDVLWVSWLGSGLWWFLFGRPGPSIQEPNTLCLRRHALKLVWRHWSDELAVGLAPFLWFVRSRHIFVAVACARVLFYDRFMIRLDTMSRVMVRRLIHPSFVPYVFFFCFFSSHFVLCCVFADFNSDPFVSIPIRSFLHSLRLGLA